MCPIGSCSKFSPNLLFSVSQRLVMWRGSYWVTKTSFKEDFLISVHYSPFSLPPTSIWPVSLVEPLTLSSCDLDTGIGEKLNCQACNVGWRWNILSIAVFSKVWYEITFSRSMRGLLNTDSLTQCHRLWISRFWGKQQKLHFYKHPMSYSRVLTLEDHFSVVLYYLDYVQRILGKSALILLLVGRAMKKILGILVGFIIYYHSVNCVALRFG